jgi:uncharacterized protein YecT (DUF1311 family)
MSYLKAVKAPNQNIKIDCNNTSGSNIEHRVCLNIQLRRTDSLMLSKFNKLLHKTESDSLKTILLDFQNNWEFQRKSISLIMADGLENNAEAIVYMHSMQKLTELRLLALNYILEEDY